MKKALFVVNPAAGQKKIKASLADILSLFNGEQYETAVYMTRKETSVEDYVAERCKNFDLLVCCGKRCYNAVKLRKSRITDCFVFVID